MSYHTISVRGEIYARLRSMGKFQESFSDLLERILDSIQTKEER